MYFFIHGGGGGLPKNYSDEGGAMRKKSEIGGGVIQFSNYTPPNPTSPPYPIKNERSLRCLTFVIPLVSQLLQKTGALFILINEFCNRGRDRK